MKSDRLALEDCIPEISEQSQKELKEKSLGTRAVHTEMNKGKPTGLGTQGYLELLGALMRMGYLPQGCPKAQKTKAKHEARYKAWQEMSRNMSL